MILKKLLLDFCLTLISFASISWFLSVAVSQEYIVISLVGASVLVLGIFTLGGYHQNKTIFELAIIMMQSWIIAAMAVFGMIFIAGFDAIGRTILLLWMIITPLVLIVSHYLLSRYILAKQQTIYAYGSHYNFTPHERKRLKKQKVILQEIDDLNNVTHGNVLINTPEHLQYNAHTQVNYLSLSYFMERYLRKCHIEHITDIERITGYSNSQKVLKTIIDYTLALIILPIALIGGIVSTIMISMQSKGQILFRQNRMSAHQRVFTLYKFRSMHENSHFDPYTQENDLRIFPYGNFMRKMRIDELPQIINILKGDMSLIGPRAEWDILAKEYEQEIGYYHLRSLIKPGITGWAQVNYPYGANIEDTKQKLMYDLYYIKNWSLALELEIIVKTARIIFNQSGL